jgi:trehalose synthase
MNTINIEDYAPIVGRQTLEELRTLAGKLEGKKIQHINSTAVGGGVAEILSRMIPWLEQLGLDTKWNVIKGDERFFVITKQMFNALHGAPAILSDDDLAYFLGINRMNAAEIDPASDFILVHDHQPAPLIDTRHANGAHWVWRCHMDFSKPDAKIWNFIKEYIERYEAAIFSATSFARDLPIRQLAIAPSIDPLSDKNKELPEETVRSVLEGFGIDPSRPIVTQVSRFDSLKDPVGVVRAYKMAKTDVDIQLVLAGGGAADDPEGPGILERVKAESDGDKDIFILFLPPGSDTEINALQRGSTVIVQKSLREGFGLTVTEALWKAKPVVAGAAGGIPLQVTHKQTGILTHTIDETAFSIKMLIQQPEYARQLGLNGREHVRKNFLITRHIKDYLSAFLSIADRDKLASR